MTDKNIPTYESNKEVNKENMLTKQDELTRKEALAAYSKLSIVEAVKLNKLYMPIIDWYVTKDLISIDVRLAAKERNPNLYQVVTAINSFNGFSYTAISRYHKALIDIIMTKDSLATKIELQASNNTGFTSASDILIASFNWNKTKQRHSYWNTLYKTLKTFKG